MSGPKRYDIEYVHADADKSEMVESDIGDFVAHADYVAREAELLSQLAVETGRRERAERRLTLVREVLREGAGCSSKTVHDALCEALVMVYGAFVTHRSCLPGRHAIARTDTATGVTTCQDCGESWRPL